MKKTIVTDKALRELVNEVLDGYVPEQSGGVKVNKIVDPLAALTDPMNPDYRPQNKTELGVAVKQLTQGMDDGQASKVYDTLKKAIGDDEKSKTDAEKKKETEEMKKDNNSSLNTTGTKSGTHSGTTATESYIRAVVRALINEKFEAYDDVVSPQGDDDDLDPPVPMHPDEDEKSFEDIAAELGMAVAGAKQFVDKAKARWHFLGKSPTASLKSKQTASGDRVTTFEPPEQGLEDLDILILKAWADYIDLLASAGPDTVTSADIKLMHDHPEVAFELDGFREFLHEYIQTAAIPTDVSGQPWLQKHGGTKADVHPKTGQTKDDYDTAIGGQRTYQNAPNFKGDYDWLEDEDSAKYSSVKKKAGNRVTKDSEKSDKEDDERIAS